MPSNALNRKFANNKGSALFFNIYSFIPTFIPHSREPGPWRGEGLQDGRHGAVQGARPRLGGEQRQQAGDGREDGGRLEEDLGQ